MEDDDKPVKNIKEKPTPTLDAPPTEVTEKPNNILLTDLLGIQVKPEPLRNKKSYLKKVLDIFLEKYPKNYEDSPNNDMNIDKFEAKRLKRQIKIRYEDESTTNTPKGRFENPDDDELFVEIETHFDSKGMKGKKKEKLIRHLIDKIQKAIHSDVDNLTRDKKKKHKHLSVKKRIQNPLDRKSTIMDKLPMDTLENRLLAPITKSVPLDRYSDKSGDNWKKTYFGPGFLAVSKSMNSAEMGEVDVDYNKVMAVNGIPQRLQKPLNTDENSEAIGANTYFDLGKLKFFIKNIDGTGLSIGFNQYTDEPPDPDTIKLFTGIENLVQKYNKNYASEFTPQSSKQKTSSEEIVHVLSKRDANRKNHLINRRSLKVMHEKDYHSNEYKVIFSDNFLPYTSYQDIYEDKKSKVSVPFDRNHDKVNYKSYIENIKERGKFNELPSLIDDNVFYKKLKPSEILSLASLLNRKKRHINVKKISNIKNKIKLNRYINTNSMKKKKIFLNKKRYKRQIDKIRIIATDSLSKARHSGENIFLVDDDNISADRAIIREIDTPETVDNMDEKAPEINEQPYEVFPYVYEEQPYATNVFDSRSRHNQLMSKYPHIFMEEVGRSREDTGSYVIKPKKPVENIQILPENKTTEVEKPMSKLDDLVNAIEPKQNYKLTVKIFPKNNTDLNSGFKEIHTTINKSFNKDGVMYSTLVNVSEISKVEKVYETMPSTVPLPIITTESPFAKHLVNQGNKMDLLLKRHKKRIDDRLDHLKKERFNLDTFNIKGTGHVKIFDHLKSTEPTEKSKPPELHMSKDDIGKLLASALFILQSQNKETTTTNTLTTQTTSATTPKIITTTEQDKIKILNQIQLNENVTHQILNQISKNTELLQTFLLKLTEKLTKEREEPSRHEKVPTQTEYLPKFWKQFQSVPQGLYPSVSYDSPKNETHISVPLFYAYQNPFLMNNKQTIPVASVVYHGHIHTDSLKHLKSHENKAKNPNHIQTNENGKGNQTKYFIDQYQNNVLPSVSKNVTVSV